MKNPLLSFITPVFNTSCIYLQQCLDSMLELEKVSYEIIVVNDGSTDEAVNKLLNEYSKNDEIKVLHKKNGGVSSARNLGLNVAKGQYLLFVDADDYINAKDLEKAILEMGKYPEINFFAFTHNDVNENGKPTMLGCNRGEWFHCSSVFNLYNVGKSHGASIIRESACAKIYRKKRIERIRFDESLKYGEDSFFVLEACATDTAIMACSLPFYNIRRGQESATNNYIPTILNDRLKTVFRIRAFYETNHFEGQFDAFAKDVIFRTYLHLVLRTWVFHPKFPHGFLASRKKAIEILQSEPFSSSLSCIVKDMLSRKEAVIYLLLRNKMVFLAYALFRLKKPAFLQRI